MDMIPQELWLGEQPLLAVDYLFAKRVLPKGPYTFLAYLFAMAREGHLCISIEHNRLYPPLEKGCESALIEEAKALPPLPCVIRANDRFYLRKNWEYEVSFQQQWKRLEEAVPSHAIPREWVIQELANWPLNKAQKEAILQATQQTITLICGGPGTGKTYTAAFLIELFQRYQPLEVIVAAPTGKAAANLRLALKEKVSCEIKTLHALLKQPPPLTADLVVIDEGSMIDAYLFTKLVKAVKTGARLVLLGDRDQLPPIEAGSFFADLSDYPPRVVFLEQSLRTDLETILCQAAALKRGELIPYEPLPRVETLVEEYKERNTMLLTPLRQGLYGVDHLNALFHQKKRSPLIPILITQNDSELELYNGDLGVLNLETQTVQFREGRVFREEEIPLYEYAYALSVHKSQGSEYEDVCILLPEGSESFGKEMLYTALTRAKRTVRILAHKGVMEKLLTRPSNRFSGLTAKN